MIREIHIRNYALIDDCSLEFDKGLSIVTGETGAGKSILAGAISLLMGERASAEAVRAGEEEAEVSGVFETDAGRPEVLRLLRELDLASPDGTLVIRRKISRGDRNRIQVNQAPVPLAALKRLGDSLVDLHGQHEHQSLLNEETHTAVIDDLPGVCGRVTEYSSAYAAYAAARSAEESFDAQAAALAERREVLEFQHKELAQLSLAGGEEEELSLELSLLSSAAQRGAAASEIIGLLSSPQDSLEARIAAVRKKCETLAKYDPSIRQWVDDIGNTLAVFTELEAFCSAYLEKTGGGADPARLDRLNDRLARIQRLRKKHNCTLDGLIAKQASLKRDLDSIVNVDADRAELRKKAAACRDACMRAGKALSAARSAAAAAFDRKVTALLEEFGFSGGLWRTEFADCGEPQAVGLERARFMVRTNRGEPLLPLVKTASGGEISRLMLAIKTVMSAHDRIGVLIFDEIDTGIGGLLAHAVGAALKRLAATHQVLCITHLHQIASLADHHFHVYKEPAGGRTVTRVKKLTEEERVGEIARMLGGDSAAAMAHARELLAGTKPKRNR